MGDKDSVLNRGDSPAEKRGSIIFGPAGGGKANSEIRQSYGKEEPIPKKEKKKHACLTGEKGTGLS